MPYGSLTARDHRRLRTLEQSLWQSVIELWERFGDYAERRPDVFPFLGACRRSPRRQAQLYTRGRTSPGPIVTNARPWESAHVYGLAFHIILLRRPGGPWLSDDDIAWDVLGELGERLGLTWGGRWGLRDCAHFEHPRWPELAAAQIAETRDRWRHHYG